MSEYRTKIDPDHESAGIADLDETELFGCFGWVRSRRDHCPMLILHANNGNKLAIAYSWIDRTLFDPPEGITIYAGPTSVTIQGKNLDCEVRPGLSLLAGLARHRISWIAEESGDYALLPNPRSTKVTSLSWK